MCQRPGNFSFVDVKQENCVTFTVLLSGLQQRRSLNLKTPKLLQDTAPSYRSYHKWQLDQWVGKCGGEVRSYPPRCALSPWPAGTSSNACYLPAISPNLLPSPPALSGPDQKV